MGKRGSTCRPALAGPPRTANDCATSDRLKCNYVIDGGASVGLTFAVRAFCVRPGDPALLLPERPPPLSQARPTANTDTAIRHGDASRTCVADALSSAKGIEWGHTGEMCCGSNFMV